MPECFTILSNEIEGRIDPSPYHPIRLNTIKKIKSSKFQLLPLKEVVEFSKKLVTSKADSLIYVGLENIESNTGVFIPSEEEKESFGTALKFEKGDILFPKLRPYLNKVYLAEFDGVCSTEFYVLKAKKCDKMYLFSFLNSQLVVNQTSYLMTGNTLPRLQTAEVENLLIPIPSTQIQNKIIEKIKEIRENRKSKESQAQQLLDSINDYVLDELGIKPPELEDKMTYVVYADDVKGKRIDAYYYQPKFEEIEKAIERGKYEVKELKETLEYYKKGIEVGSNAYVDEGIPFIRVADIDDYKIKYDNTDKKIRLKLYEKLKEYQPKKDELLFSKDGSVGFCVVVNENKDSIISGGILRLKVKKDINNFYIKTILSSKFFKILTERESIGSIIKHLTPEVFLNLKIPLPPLPIQNKIAEEVKRRMQKAEQEVERIIFN